MEKPYANHAAVWDWDGTDNTPEYEYWCGYAARFGKKVLLPMCALGQTGAYMAQKGFVVTAFDITPEMVEEGRKRFGNVENFSLTVADLCDFSFAEKQFDFAFLATQDLHLLDGMEAVRRAFAALAAHLRQCGCLALELILPTPQSYAYPAKTFHPRVPNFADKKVWKDSKGRYDAAEKKQYIDQIVYIQDENTTKSFEHSIVLQYFEREEILDALSRAGFALAREHGGRDKEPWAAGNSSWAVEAIRQ